MPKAAILRNPGRVLSAVMLLAIVSYAGVSSLVQSRAAGGAAAAPANVAGPNAPTGNFANGSVLPNGRLVTPTGTRFTLGDFPLGLALSPDGALAVAINSGQGYGLNGGFNSYCGQGQGTSPCPYVNPSQPVLARTVGSATNHAPDESLRVVNLHTGAVSVVKAVNTTYNPALRGKDGTFNYFYNGVVFSPDGTHLYAAGGGNDAVYDFPVHGDVVGPKPLRTISLPSGVPFFLSAGITKGLAATADGRYLLVTQELNNSLDIVNTSSYSATQIALGTPLLGGAYPYGVVVSADSRRAYVALEGSAGVAVIDLQEGKGTLRGTIHVGNHPTALVLSPDGAQLYVANAGDDTLSIVSTANAQVAATIPLHVLPDEAHGATPDAVAVSPDGQRIYVALAGDDAIAVLGTHALPGQAGRGPSRSSPKPTGFMLEGFIPTGWYPSAVAVGPRNGTVYIVSAKGLGSSPTAITSTYQYDANNMPGLLQVVPEPDGAHLRSGREAAMQDIQFATTVDAIRSPHNPIPASSGGATPIKHVIVIVRENRTFDQVLGDVGPDQGRDRGQVDGNPAYTIFGRDVTPNVHALVGDPLPGTADPAYAAADNFYSDGEASIQGHYWTTSAQVSDYVEKSWRLYYSPRHHLQNPISSIAEPRTCSIFQSALKRTQASAGSFSFRDYGEVTGIANADLIVSALHLPGNASPGVPELCTPIPSTNVTFAVGSNFDLDSDNRITAKGFLADVGLNVDGTAAKAARGLANFSYLIMAGDHTGGLSFKNTPRSRVAQNDAGLALIVQALSHSSYWSSTAILVMEDDSQDGLDHRDGHRNLLFVISPYAKHTGLDGKPGYFGHYHYSQASVLKTIDLLCGFPYLSTYDQNASPLYDLFQDKDAVSQLTRDDLAPFSVQPAPSFIDETSAHYTGSNAAVSMLVRQESRSLNLWVPDMAGPLLEVVNWQLAHPQRAVPAALRREQGRWHPYSFGGPDRDGS